MNSSSLCLKKRLQVLDSVLGGMAWDEDRNRELQRRNIYFFSSLDLVSLPFEESKVKGE